MPVLTQNLQTSTPQTSLLQNLQRQMVNTKRDDEIDKACLADTISNSTEPIMIPINFEQILTKKENEIKNLSEALESATSQLEAKTLQAQQVNLWTQKVAQMTKKNYSLKTQNFTLKSKLTLFRQVNQRQFSEMTDLDHEKALLNQKISQLEQQLRGQVASMEMKLGELRMQVSEEKRKNCKLQKQVTLLKAIINELQENEDSQLDSAYCSWPDCYKSSENKLNQYKCQNHQRQPHHCGFRGNCSEIRGNCSENMKSDPYGASFGQGSYEISSNFQEQIVFM